MDNDYGIRAACPDLPPQKVEEVKNKLLNEFKVGSECKLEDLEIEDLTEGGLLGKIAARKLIKSWKKGSGTTSKPTAKEGSVSISVGGNAGEVKAAARDIHETHHGSKITTFGDYLGSEATKSSVTTDMGNAKINVTGAMHTGKGDIGSSSATQTKQIKKGSGASKATVNTKMEGATIAAGRMHTGEGDIHQ